MASLRVQTVQSPRELNQFIKLPWKIYAQNPCWVPHLIRDDRRLLDRAHNPFFEHAEAEYFLAFRDETPIGRIAAIKNDAHNRFHGDTAGFFGFFECDDDADAARLLFDAARDWLKARKLSSMRGPFNFSTNEECGLLVKGFDGMPAIMMPYNHEYYPKLYESYGLTKAKDLLAYFVATNEPPERVVRFCEKVMKRHEITFRSANRKRLDDEIALVKDIYNSAWEKNWGFVPMTDGEFAHMASQLREILVPEFLVFAFVRGEAAAFSLMLSDINPALKKANGRLFPFGFLHILRGLKNATAGRVVTMGVKKDFRRLGLESIVILETYRAGRARGITHGEMSWILEDNEPMVRVLEKLGADQYRTYRIYETDV